MKLYTSFVKPPKNLVPLLSVTGWLISLCLLSLSIYMVYAAKEIQEKNVMLVEQYQKLDAKWSAVNASNKLQLTNEKFYQLKNKLSEINNITEMGELDIALILSRLEILMPDTFYLLSLHYRSTANSLTLVFESLEVDKVTSFIDKLETESLFNDIAIIRQSEVINKGKSAIQFEVTLKTGNNRGSV